MISQRVVLAHPIRCTRCNHIETFTSDTSEQNENSFMSSKVGKHARIELIFRDAEAELEERRVESSSNHWAGRILCLLRACYGGCRSQLLGSVFSKVRYCSWPWPAYRGNGQYGWACVILSWISPVYMSWEKNCALTPAKNKVHYLTDVISFWDARGTSVCKTVSWQGRISYNLRQVIIGRFRISASKSESGPRARQSSLNRFLSFDDALR